MPTRTCKIGTHNSNSMKTCTCIVQGIYVLCLTYDCSSVNPTRVPHAKPMCCYVHVLFLVCAVLVCVRLCCNIKLCGTVSQCVCYRHATLTHHKFSASSIPRLVFLTANTPLRQQVTRTIASMVADTTSNSLSRNRREMQLLRIWQTLHGTCQVSTFQCQHARKQNLVSWR